MAQVAAIEYDMSGYGQNSLPISAGLISQDYLNEANFDSAFTAWQGAGNTFTPVVSSGDPATIAYVAGIYAGSGDKYLSGDLTILDNAYPSLEELGIKMIASGDPRGVEQLIAGAAGAHSIFNVVDELSSYNTVQITPGSTPLLTMYLNQAELESSGLSGSHAVDNSDGTVSFINTNGVVVSTVSAAANSANPFPGETEDQITIPGQATETVAVADNTGQTYNTADIGASVFGDFYGGNTIEVGNSGVAVNASADTIDLSSGTSTTVDGQSNALYGNGATLTLNADSTGTVSGYGDSINANGIGVDIDVEVVNSTISSSFSGDTFQATRSLGNTFSISNDIVDINGIDSDATISGDGNTVNALGNGISLTLTGNNETVNTAAGELYGQDGNDQITINGTNESLNLGYSEDADTINVSSGGSANISASNVTINVAAGASVELSGSNDTVNMGSGSDVLTLDAGFYDLVTNALAGNTVDIDGPALAELQGSGGAVQLFATGAQVDASGENVAVMGVGISDVVVGNNNSISASQDTVTVVGQDDSVSNAGGTNYWYGNTDGDSSSGGDNWVNGYDYGSGGGDGFGDGGDGGDAGDGGGDGGDGDGDGDGDGYTLVVHAPRTPVIIHNPLIYPITGHTWGSGSSDISSGGLEHDPCALGARNRDAQPAAEDVISRKLRCLSRAMNSFDQEPIIATFQQSDPDTVDDLRHDKILGTLTTAMGAFRPESSLESDIRYSAHDHLDHVLTTNLH